MNLKIILILSVSHICIDLAGAALPAIMPLFKEKLELSFTAVGIVIMASYLTSSFIQPFSGYLSDKIRMKWLLPLSFCLTTTGFSLSGLAPSYLILMLLVVINGIGVAVYHPEATKTMHFFSGSRMATGMSLFQVGGNLGLALGPLLISYAVKVAYLRGTLFYLMAGLPMLILLSVFNKEFHSKLKQAGSVSQGEEKTSSSRGMSKRRASMILLILAVSLRSWAHMGLIYFIPFYYIQILQGDPLSAGRLVFIFLAGGVAGTLLGAMIADRMGHKYYFLLSMLISAPLLYVLLRVEGFLVLLILFMAGFALISSFSVTIVMGQRLMPDRLGMASGIMTGLVIGIGGVGAGLLGMAADAWGIMAVMRLIVLMPLLGSLPIFPISYPSATARKGEAVR